MACLVQTDTSTVHEPAHRLMPLNWYLHSPWHVHFKLMPSQSMARIVQTDAFTVCGMSSSYWCLQSMACPVQTDAFTVHDMYNSDWCLHSPRHVQFKLMPSQSMACIVQTDAFTVLSLHKDMPSQSVACSIVQTNVHSPDHDPRHTDTLSPEHGHW